MTGVAQVADVDVVRWLNGRFRTRRRTAADPNLPVSVLPHSSHWNVMLENIPGNGGVAGPDLLIYDIETGE